MQDRHQLGDTVHDDGWQRVFEPAGRAIVMSRDIGDT
jgi:hypothetical protein